MSIVYHRYVANGDSVEECSVVVDENVVVEIRDWEARDDEQLNDLNTMSVVEVIVVENVLVEDDDDETYDAKNDQDDEAKQEVSIGKL